MLARIALLVCALTAISARHTSRSLKQEQLAKKTLIDAEFSRTHVQCAYQSDDIIGVKNCTLPSDKPDDDWRVACYYLSWGGKTTQDCWIHQEVAVMDQCQPTKCSVGESTAGVDFCCCFGDKCNSEENVIPPSKL